MDEIFVSKEHFTSRPDCTGRLDKEIRVYEVLDKLGIPYEGVDHDVAPTIEACQAIETELGIMPCKNLFLRNRQKTTFFLLLMPGKRSLSPRICPVSLESPGSPLRNLNLWRNIWTSLLVLSVYWV